MEQFIYIVTIDTEGPIGTLGKNCAIRLANEEFGIEKEDWGVGMRRNKTAIMFKTPENANRFVDRLTEVWS